MLALILLAACVEPDDDDANTPASAATSSATSPTPAGQGGAGRMERLRAVNDFLYQLQGLDLEAVASSAYDLIVMDYSTQASPCQPLGIRAHPNNLFVVSLSDHKRVIQMGPW